MAEMLGSFVGFAFVLAGWAWLGCALLAGAVAQSKGRNGLAWFVLGVLFGVFALIAVSGMTTIVEEHEVYERIAEAQRRRREQRQAARMEKRTGAVPQRVPPQVRSATGD